MSKITAKNLVYDSTLPPFLARLQASNAFSDDQQKVKIIRPQKARDLEAEAEDEPVYFDEETNHTLTKKEWLAQEEEREEIRAKQLETQSPSNVAENEKTQVEMVRNIATHGLRRKKKVGRVIGNEGNDIHKDNSPLTKTVTGKSAGSGIRKPKPSEKAKNKKRIKLSFDE